MEISLARALTELKTMDARIKKGLNNATFYGEARKSSDRIRSQFSREDFEKKLKADYQSITDLIERRKVFKEVIDKTNAMTTVEVANKVYTILGAINRKNSIQLDIDLLNELKTQRRISVNLVEQKNREVEQDLTDIINSRSSSDSKDNNKADNKEFSRSYRDMHEWEVIDFLKIDKLIEDLEFEIDSFQSDVDASLSEINAVTIVVVPD